MAAAQLTTSSRSTRNLPSFDGLRVSSSTLKILSLPRLGLSQGCLRGRSVQAVTVVAPKYTTLKPLGDRVLVKINTAEEKTTGEIFLPTTDKLNLKEVRLLQLVRAGESEEKIGNCAKVVYSKYAGTEVELNGTNHLILKEDDIVGILETDDVKDLKPLNDRVLIKVAEAEEKTAGGLLLTDSSKEKPSVGTVIAAGPGPIDEEENRKPLSIAPGNTVLYSKYAGNNFKGADSSNYIALRASDVMAILA